MVAAWIYISHDLKHVACRGAYTHTLRIGYLSKIKVPDDSSRIWGKLVVVENDFLAKSHPRKSANELKINGSMKIREISLSRNDRDEESIVVLRFVYINSRQPRLVIPNPNAWR